MNQQPTKRRNPFEKMLFEQPEENEETKIQESSLKIEEEQPVVNEVEPEPVIEEVKTVQQPVYQPQPQQQIHSQPQYYQQKQQPRQTQQQNRVVKRQTQNYYMQQEVEVRDKFTSTMEQSLRRSIKVVCAQRGIMFAQFVEDACREKLEREGFR